MYFNIFFELARWPGEAAAAAVAAAAAASAARRRPEEAGGTTLDVFRPTRDSPPPSAPIHKNRATFHYCGVFIIYFFPARRRVVSKQRTADWLQRAKERLLTHARKKAGTASEIDPVGTSGCWEQSKKKPSDPATRRGGGGGMSDDITVCVDSNIKTHAVV